MSELPTSKTVADRLRRYGSGSPDSLLLMREAATEIERLTQINATLQAAEVTRALEAVENCEQIQKLRAALLMMMHAYQTDNRPNMVIVHEALATRAAPESRDG